MPSPELSHPDVLFVFLELLKADESRALDLDRSRSFAEMPAEEGELDLLFEDLLETLGNHRVRLEEAWGNPNFAGTPADDDFPEWSEALALAYWTHEDRWAYLALHHHDEDQPLLLQAGVRLLNDSSPTALTPWGIDPPEVSL